MYSARILRYRVVRYDGVREWSLRIDGTLLHLYHMYGPHSALSDLPAVYCRHPHRPTNGTARATQHCIDEERTAGMCGTAGGSGLTEE